MENCNFNFSHYRKILRAAKENRIFAGFLEKPSPGKKIIYLKHDIDTSLENALKMAQIEEEEGVLATYLVRTHAGLYNPFCKENTKVLEKIAGLGHKIGLHYDKEIPDNFNLVDLEKDIQKEYAFLNSFIGLEKVMSFHRPSQKVLGLDLKGITSTYSKHFFEEMEYISDSNRDLRRGCMLDFIKNHPSDNIQMLIHPFWWNEKTLSLKELYEKLRIDNSLRIEKELRENIKGYRDFNFRK